MNIQQIVLASVTVVLMSTGDVWAEKNDKYDRHRNYVRIHDGRNSDHPRAPEIDSASGTSALVLLAGALLLASERSRSRGS